MTAHWIDEETLKRSRAVLCCKELTVSHTFDVLAKEMQDVHRLFDVQCKVKTSEQLLSSNYNWFPLTHTQETFLCNFGCVWSPIRVCAAVRIQTDKYDSSNQESKLRLVAHLQKLKNDFKLAIAGLYFSLHLDVGKKLMLFGSEVV